MTFLKKLGQILLKGVGIAASIGGLSLPFLGSGKAAQIGTTVINDLTQMSSMAIAIEAALQGKPGTEKLAALIPLITNIVRTSEVVSGKKIADEAKFTLACQEYAQATVDLLNSIHPDEAKTA